MVDTLCLMAEACWREANCRFGGYRTGSIREQAEYFTTILSLPRPGPSCFATWSLRSPHEQTGFLLLGTCLLTGADVPHLGTLSSSGHFEPEAPQDLGSTQHVVFGVLKRK
jgi:hypothetical protein